MKSQCRCRPPDSRRFLMLVCCMVLGPSQVFSLSIPSGFRLALSRTFRRLPVSMSAVPDADPANVTTGTDSSQDTKKFHHWTVCMVPPPQYLKVWELVMQARSELRDPGLYRWPPHANLLYPFLNSYCSQKTNDDSIIDNIAAVVDKDILDRLSIACRQCEPFPVRLRDFGTFGGSKRGVLWLYPDSRTIIANQSETTPTTSEPLKDLQAYLEEQFPICADQSKVSGTFNPHMTLSHFVNLQAALDGQSQVESWRSSSADEKDWEFVMDRVYLLYRQGDAGQFRIVAEVPLGKEQKEVLVHNPPLEFPGMPQTEVDWVREQRMQLKQRRNKRGGRRRGGNGSRMPPLVPDTPEVIAAKRAARQAKREAASQASQVNE